MQYSIIAAFLFSIAKAQDNAITAEVNSVVGSLLAQNNMNTTLANQLLVAANQVEQNFNVGASTSSVTTDTATNAANTAQVEQAILGALTSTNPLTNPSVMSAFQKLESALATAGTAGQNANSALNLGASVASDISSGSSVWQDASVIAAKNQLSVVLTNNGQATMASYVQQVYPLIAYLATQAQVNAAAQQAAAAAAQKAAAAAKGSSSSSQGNAAVVAGSSSSTGSNTGTTKSNSANSESFGFLVIAAVLSPFLL